MKWQTNKTAQTAKEGKPEEPETQTRREPKEESETQTRREPKEEPETQTRQEPKEEPETHTKREPKKTRNKNHKQSQIQDQSNKKQKIKPTKKQAHIIERWRAIPPPPITCHVSCRTSDTKVLKGAVQGAGPYSGGSTPAWFHYFAVERTPTSTVQPLRSSDSADRLNAAQRDVKCNTP